MREGGREGGREEGRERERERGGGGGGGGGEGGGRKGGGGGGGRASERARYLRADDIAPDGREIVSDFEPEVLKHVAHGAALKMARQGPEISELVCGLLQAAAEGPSPLLPCCIGVLRFRVESLRSAAC